MSPIPSLVILAQPTSPENKETTIYPILQLGPFHFYTFGLCVGAAFCLGAFTFDRFFKRHNIPLEVIPCLAVILVASLLGGKLDYSLITRTPPTLMSGYTYFGALTAAVAAMAVYTRRLAFLHTFDALFCVAPAYALGRLGCFLAGDGDYGRPSNLPWAVAFPHGMVPTTTRVHPSMLYIALWELAVFAVLWHFSRSSTIRVPRISLLTPGIFDLQPSRRRPGTLLALYLIATGSGRFLIEFLSHNRKFVFGLTEAQGFGLSLAVTGAALIAFQADGLPIDRYCTEHDLSLEARLRLFIRVAEVVQSAHQQLILHLDLKPANILVTPAGELRLLDFGQLQRDPEARTYFEQAMHDTDSQNGLNTIEIAEHHRSAHRLYAQFLLARGELARAAEVSAILRPPEQPTIAAGKGTFDMVEYGFLTEWWAILSAYQGHRAESLENIRKSLAVTGKLLHDTPDDKTLTAQHAIHLIRFAELPGMDPVQARAMLAEAIPLTSAYSHEHPTVLGAQVLGARAHLALARLAQQTHNLQTRKTDATQALALLEPVVQQRPRLREAAELVRAARKLTR